MKAVSCQQGEHLLLMTRNSWFIVNLPPTKGILVLYVPRTKSARKRRHVQGYRTLLFCDVGIHVGCIRRSRVSSSKDDSILRNYKENSVLKLRLNIMPFAVREGQCKNKIT